MVVQHNVSALNANRMLGLTVDTKTKSTEKLSSGYKINRAADDAAGLAISEKMRRQVRGLTQATSNCQDGIACVQTAEGALNEVHDMLQRMNELAVKAKNGTNQSYDREYIQSEMNQLSSEISRTAQQTTFNKLQLLGSFSKSVTPGKYGSLVGQGTNTERWTFKLQVGTERSHCIEITLSSMKASSIGVGTGDIKVSTSTSAGNAIMSIDKAIQSVSKLRSELGAIQNRLEHTITNLKNTVENTTSAESNIRDTDMATEMVKFANTNILAQAGQAMLSQANQNNQGVLSLLG